MPERKKKKKGRLKTRPPGTALSFIPLGQLSGRKSIPILTQTGKQKPSHPLQALPPCLAAPVPTAYSWQLVLGAQNPRTQSQAAGMKGGQGSPHPTPCPNRGRTSVPTPTLGPPQGPGIEPAQDTVSLQGSKAGLLYHALPQPRPHPRQPGGPPELQDAPGRPAASHCAQPCSTSALRESSGLGTRHTNKSQLTTPAAASPLSLGVLLRALGITGFCLRQLLSPGWAKRQPN